MTIRELSAKPESKTPVCDQGNPGLEDAAERVKRRDADAAQARQLRAIAGGQAKAVKRDASVAGAGCGGSWREWLANWYAQPLFGQVARAPGFEALLQRRQEADPATMAEVLAGCSPGRVPAAWRVIETSSVPVMFAHGALDAKFAGIAAQVQDRARPACQAGAHSGGGDGGDAKQQGAHMTVVAAVEGAAHALLEEAPEASARAVADFLAAHPAVASVNYPRLQTGNAARRAHTYLQGGYGGLVGFELKDGLEAGKAFINALKLFYHVANIGDTRSLAIHPASTTHSQLSPEEQRDTGVTEGYVRLSVGIEHIDDIIADLTQALDGVGGALNEAAE